MSAEETTQQGGRHLRRRKNLIINPAFQLRYAGTIMLGVFIASSLMSIVLYGLLFQQARNRLLHLAPSNIMENTYAIILFAAAFSLLMALALGVWSIVMTHRIGGPLYVMQKQLEELAQGRIPKLRRLRKRDEFKQLFGTFKEFVNGYKSQKQRQFQELEQALQLVDKFKAEGGASVSALQELEVQLRAMRNAAAQSLGKTESTEHSIEGTESETKTSLEPIGAA